MTTRAALGLTLGLLVAACSSAETSTNDGAGGAGGDGGAGAGGVVYTGPTCEAVAAEEPNEPTQHVDECSTVIYNSNPPSSGNHYATWAAFQSYDQPVPRGYYVHCLEHGAVALLYNCPDGCPDDVARFKALAAAAPHDVRCDGDEFHAEFHRRVIITPDPKLDVRFAASAWGFTLKAPCVDEASFAAFLAAHTGHAVEDFCNDGVDVIARGVPAGCGE
jgi:hypothetical protein